MSTSVLKALPGKLDIKGTHLVFSINCLTSLNDNFDLNLSYVGWCLMIFIGWSHRSSTSGVSLALTVCGYEPIHSFIRVTLVYQHFSLSSVATSNNHKGFSFEY